MDWSKSDIREDMEFSEEVDEMDEPDMERMEDLREQFELMRMWS